MDTTMHIFTPATSHPFSTTKGHHHYAITPNHLDRVANLDETQRGIRGRVRTRGESSRDACVYI